MSKFRKLNISLVFVACLLCAFFCANACADEAENDVSYVETPIYIDGLLSTRGYLDGEVTYLPLETACAVLGYDTVSDFNLDKNMLTVSVAGFDISVCKDKKYFTANGRYFFMADGYREIDGLFAVPIDVLAKLFTLELSWDEKLEAFDLNTANEAPLVSGGEFYDEDDLYWMSRIITYEAGNQPIEGQIGVGNVVLNRVESDVFADTVKDVIFQPGQFNPVESKAIYLDPFESGTISAKLAFEGYNTVGDSLYFHQGNYGEKWMNEHENFVIKIGDHNFFRRIDN